MSFLAIHRSAGTSLAVDQPWLSAEEWTACQSAVDLLTQLQALHSAQAARLELEAAQARGAGFAAGREQGLRQASEGMAASWVEAADAAQLQARELREAVITLSLEVIRRITAELAPQDVVAALARRAGEDLMPDRAARLRVHPQAAAAVAQRLAGLPQIEVKPDASLHLTDCVFDTPAGEWLAGLEVQLQRISQSLREESRKAAE
jgi:flagellar biosynthesis/type III secretory pathway protein FliH